MKKILIVDDDPTLRTVLTRHLEHQGFLVCQAESGQQALSVFESSQPDLVVSDVLMPDMDGFEFCRQLRATRTGQLVPFIFLSSCDDTCDRIQGHQIGGDDYVVKPFDPRELIAKIDAQLERSRRVHAEMIRLIQQSGAAATSAASGYNGEDLPLTPAEEKVFWQVIQGFTNKQIGQRLLISPRTVQTHLSSILNKLNLENRSQLIRYAFERGYRPPADWEAVD
jgi:DNA-binding response OmpR family regulator